MIKPIGRPMRFEFATATRIIFGPGSLKEVGPLAAELGHKALVITGRNAARARPVLETLAQSGIDYVTFSVVSEPTIDMVREGTKRARETKYDLIVGFGGGSVIDSGKAVAALLTNGGDPLDYVEVIGKGLPLTKPAVPYIAVPTTASGTEVTRNAVLASPEHRVKVSLRSPLMLPRLAVVDPELTYSLPPQITAGTCLDALAQVMEPYVSNRANPMTDALCREGMRRAARSLRRVYEQGEDQVAREDMAITGLFGGLALANAKLGAVHGFGGAIGGMLSAPHGAVCGCLLPHVTAINVRALQERLPESEALQRYDEIGRILTRSARATSWDGVSWMQETCKLLQIPPLASYGLRREDFSLVIEKAAVASSMQGNPIKLTPDEMAEILTRAL